MQNNLTLGFLLELLSRLVTWKLDRELTENHEEDEHDDLIEERERMEALDLTDLLDP